MFEGCSNQFRELVYNSVHDSSQHGLPPPFGQNYARQTDGVTADCALVSRAARRNSWSCA